MLRAVGLWEEAISLETPSLLDAALREIEAGRVLTAMDDGYPIRWMERLGDAAPPALWKIGEAPKAPMIGIVGSRQINEETRSFAHQIGASAVKIGFGVVSGGAIGCDQAGALGAIAAEGFVLELLPYGIDLYSSSDRCALAVCPPKEEFTRANAMERNTLIYSASEQTVVVQARFKEGGTWIGAVEACRRHLCRLIIRDDDSQASRALIALGGTGIQHPSELQEALDRSPTQPGLFHIG